MNNNKKSILGKVKGVLSDSLWSIAALVLLNCISQFVVYPIWAHLYDDERYGNIIYVMSLVNVFAVSVGVSANYARMSESTKRVTRNGDYNLILAVFSVLVGTMCFSLIRLSNLGMSVSESLFAALLSVATMWRYYADVEYRLSLNYKGYFIYYLVISIGYLIGVALSIATKLWPLALLPGELLGIAMVCTKGRLFHDGAFVRSEAFKQNCSTVLLLVLTNILSNTIFNGDRILLQIVLNGSAVTIYYLASLLGKTMSLITTPLNSVIIGYLARYKGNFNKKMLHIYSLFTIAAILLGTFAAVLGSHILIKILYPENYADVRDFFVIANLTQILYFITNITTTVLLRLAKANWQLVINLIYAGCFLILCIPAACFYGIWGFCAALLITNFIRYAVAIGCCYLSIKRRQET